MTPYWPPVPTSRGTVQPKRYSRGREPIEPRISCFIKLKLECDVLNSTVVRSSGLSHGARENDSHHVQKTWKLVQNFGWDLFKNDQFCFIKCALQCKTYYVIWWHWSGLNPRSPDRQTEPLPIRLLCCYIYKLLVVYNLTNSGHFTTCENEWNRRNTTKLVFPSLCPLKSRGEVFKNGFQIFQFRLNFNGTKT